jgi:hypothetical protein
MKKPTAMIALLALALVSTNAWWAHETLDAGVSSSYQGVSLEEHRQALSQALAIINVAALANATRGQVIAAARNGGPPSEPFEKDGYLWVGRLGLRFDRSGKLIEAVPSWSP